MKKLHKGLLVAVSGFIAMILAAGGAWGQSATQSAPAASSDEKATLTIGVDSDVTSLNPFNLCCGPDYTYLTYVYDIAFGYGDDLTPAPAIVESWTPNGDSTEWTLKVRDDATFNDGTPVTAEDVAFSFSFIVDNKMPFYKDYLPFNPTFTVVDPTTVLWTSEAPTFAPNVPAYIPIIPKHVWEQFVVPGDSGETKAAAKEFANENPVGSGPFVLAEYQQKQFLRFELRPDYWGGQPKSVQEVVLRIYTNQEALVAALKSGEVDFIDGVKPTLFNSLQNQDNIATHQADGGCWGNIAWNFGGQSDKANPAPIIKDKTFRQAMAYSIDRQEIVEKVYQNTSTLGYSILMPGVNGAWQADIPQDLRFDYNPDQTKQMLDSINVVDSNGDGIREDPNTGANLDLDLLTINDVSGSVDTGKLIQGYFSDVGVGSHFTTGDTDLANVVWGTGEFDAYVWDWCPDPDPDFMVSVFTSSQCGGWSDGCYANPDYDKLYALQQTQLDRADRQKTIEEMQLIIAEDVPTMVLNYWGDLQAYRTDRFTGYLPSPAVETGDLIFGWNEKSLFNLTLVGNAAAPASPGLPVWVWLALIGTIAVVVIVVAIARRRPTKEDEVV